MSSSRESRKGRRRLAWLGWVAAAAVVGLGSMAIAFGAGEPRKPDYQDYDLTRPWFDGKGWAWFLDMFDQDSIKPQEVGTIQTFPEHSVPRSGAEPAIAATAIRDGQLVRDLMPANPTQSTAESRARGKVLYDTYCAVCHGADGMAGTPVVQKGMPAPPIKPLIPAVSEPHLYNKIRYGEPIMPSYGFQTSQQDRWDMVNYMKSPEFGQGGSQ